jgi:hypothetical protein
MASQGADGQRQRRLLRKWLRYAENLKATEEEMIDHCWPETGKGLDDWDDEEDKLGSSEDLIDCQESSGGFHIARWAREQR